jgi:Tol biopolymer transport system component/predicted Ser/Thr protein kinase
MAHSTGDRLGPYEIVSMLGEGGMGQVYRAHDSRLRRDVAIKTSAQRFNDRFEREARAIAALNHPNICQIYDVGSDHIVMELVDGVSPRGPLPLDEALRIAGQIAEALEAAHEKGIVHRDLKPANIKITPGGLVKVLDFGLAKAVGEPSLDAATITMGLTGAGTVVGTPAYMSPEQAQGHAVDRRTDIWAFGVVLFELVTGRRPFEGDSVHATLAAVLAKEPDIDEAPARVRRLVHACLAKDPSNRLSGIGDWRLLLDVDTPAASTSARARWAPWAVAAAGIAVGIIGLLPFRSTPPAPAPFQFAVPIPGGVASNVMLALSPDGRHLAISANENGKFRLWVRSLDDLETRLLPGADGARFPFWSPDSSQIGFFANEKLQTILAAGGEPVVITPVHSTILGGTWARDGVIVFSQSRQLFKVNDKGGTPELLYKPEKGILHDPSPLPDGQHFLYVHNLEGVNVGSIDGAPPRRVLPDISPTVYSPDGYLLFTRQSRLTAQRFDVRTLTLAGEAVPVTRESVKNDLLATMLSASTGGAVAYVPQLPEQLVWVNQSGVQVEKVGSPQRWLTFRLSSDQTKLAFDLSLAQDAKLEVAVLDMQRGTRDQLTTEGKVAFVPIFSPDGKQVAFTSNRMGRFNPYITSARDQERLVRDMGLTGGYPVDWSPDGKNLLWWGDDDLWVVPVDGGKPDNLTRSPRFGEQTGAFSPDGRWIAYVSNESDRDEIYLMPFPADGRRRYPVSSHGGASPAWRHDGAELFYVSEGRLTAVPVTFRGEEVQFGEAQRLFPVNWIGFSRSYEPSRDGQRFLVTAPATPGSAAVTVLLNWTQAIAK